METFYPIPLKCGTQKGSVRVHLVIKFALKYDKHSQSYLLLFTKNNTIMSLSQRVNHAWYEAENWYRGKLTIKPQTFAG